MRTSSLLALVLLAAAGRAQVTMTVGAPASPDHLLDFDTPFVASGPIASNSPVFTSHGIASLSLIGGWNGGTDTITAGANDSGQSLVSQGGVLSVAGVGGQLDGPAAGHGFEIHFSAPANEFGVLFVDQLSFNYRVEMFAAGASLGVGVFNYGGSFPAPGHYWSVGSPFDQLELTFVSNTAGVGIDNLAVVSAASSTPLTYCTAGTSSAGCVPTISASALPSASGSTAPVISVSGLDGARVALIFYGIDNSGFTPLSWAGGSSFQCVKAPTQRTPAQLSGGVSGACDGALALDWNDYLGAASDVLGYPFLAGNRLYAQGWCSDPPSPKAGVLTNAVELTFLP